mmetsp:Transcript_154117/g.492868  ORF Transcript_154117/g.492868 Transcript_154117/m.492868 type:complete len:301 (-) Transcript_154117:1451-2353(-)
MLNCWLRGIAATPRWSTLQLVPLMRLTFRRSSKRISRRAFSSGSVGSAAPHMLTKLATRRPRVKESGLNTPETPMTSSALGLLATLSCTTRPTVATTRSTSFEWSRKIGTRARSGASAWRLSTTSETAPARLYITNMEPMPALRRQPRNICQRGHRKATRMWVVRRKTWECLHLFQHPQLHRSTSLSARPRPTPMPAVRPTTGWQPQCRWCASHRPILKWNGSVRASTSSMQPHLLQRSGHPKPTRGPEEQGQTWAALQTCTPRRLRRPNTRKLQSSSPRRGGSRSRTRFRATSEAVIKT